MHLLITVFLCTIPIIVCLSWLYTEISWDIKHAVTAERRKFKSTIGKRVRFNRTTLAS